MKVQEVIAKAMAKKIDVVGSGRDYGSDGQDNEAVARTDRRGRLHGPVRSAAASQSETSSDGDRREGVSLYQEKYSDFNVRHFHEKLVGKSMASISATRG